MSCSVYWRRALCLAVALLSLFGMSAGAAVPYAAFTYVYKAGELHRAPCPAPFTPVEIWDSASMQTSLGTPNDFFVAPNGDFYITDTENSAILIVGEDGKVKKKITDFMLDGQKDSFQKPEGVFVTEQGDIYVADTENNRVVVLNEAGQGLKAIIPDRSDVLGKNYLFYPRKVAVDAGGRLFVVARGQYNGIMQFTESGKFSSFIGSNRVKASALELLWRRFLTKKQREKTTQFIPLEYTNISIDEDSFLYAVTQASGETQKVKRLNPGGTDILVRSRYDEQITKNAKIADICSDTAGNYYYVDQKDGCIYAYNPDGNLLYAFGGDGEQIGTFKSPAAIAYYQDRLYVTDGVLGTVTVFEMTAYARNIQTAGELYAKNQYEESKQYWNKVLRQNANFELAYIQLGRIFYRQEQYETAMDYFKRGNFRGDIYVGGYGAAFELHRAEFLRQHMPLIFTSLTLAAAMGVLLWLWWFIRKKKRTGGGGVNE